MKINARPPDVYIDAEAMAKIRAWTHHAPGEVSGLGLVETTISEGRLESVEITEAFILKQECSGSSTELDQQDIARLLCELEQQGKADQLKFWWHSHGSLPTFWSQTDDENIERLRTGDFLLSIVVNRSWDSLARIDWYSPLQVTLDQLPLNILLPESRGLHARCHKDVEELVAEVKLVTPIKGRFWRNHRHTQQEDQIPGVDDVTADPFGYWDEWNGMEPPTPFLLEDHQP